MQKKIITRIFGGLGNQLFCYAAARRLAIKNRAELVIDDVSGFKYDTAYQRTYQLHHFNIPCRMATPSERLEPFSRIRRGVQKRVSGFRPFHKRSYITQEGMDFEQRLLTLEPRKNIYIEGYWQSEKYFKDVEEMIREDLKITGDKGEKNLELADSMSQNQSVAIHVRFFGDSDSNSNLNASSAYYKDAIDRMGHLVPDAHYYLFSDKPEEAGSLMNHMGVPFTLISHNKSDDDAYLDLWLMSQCNHFIIANSTFSWWGAWLSEFEGKTVIAPGLKKTSGTSSWGFKGLIPEEWILV